MPEGDVALDTVALGFCTALPQRSQLARQRNRQGGAETDQPPCGGYGGNTSESAKERLDITLQRGTRQPNNFVLMCLAHNGKMGEAGAYASISFSAFDSAWEDTRKDAGSRGHCSRPSRTPSSHPAHIPYIVAGSTAPTTCSGCVAALNSLFSFEQSARVYFCATCIVFAWCLESG